MDNSQLELARLASVEWSTAYLPLSKLLDKYPLPQIVKIIEGFYGERNDSTLCNNAILYLHSAKTIQKVHGYLSFDKAKEISISLDCRSKVEVRASNMKDVYESVQELCSAFPKYVRVLQAYHSKSSNEVVLNVGDKLQLKGNNKGKKIKEMLVCINQNGQEIKLPKDCVAGFQPLVDGKEYYLSDALKKFKMPLNVQFVELDSIGENARSDERPPCRPFQTICLDRLCKEKIIEATTILADGQRITMQIFPDVDIELVVCEDSFRNSADYAKVCRIFNSGTPSEDGKTQLYEDINDDAIQDMTRNKLLRPSAKPSFQKQKPVISPKPRTRDSTFHRADPVPTYEEIGFNERHNSKRESVIEDSTYTALDPTYISTRQYEKPTAMEKLQTRSSKNPPEIVDKPQVPKKPPTRLPDTSKVENCTKSEVSYSEPDRESFVKPSTTQPHNSHSIPKCPNKPPEVADKPRVPKKTGKLPISLPAAYEVSYSEPDRESFVKPSTMQPHNSHSIPKCPNKPPEVADKPRVPKKAGKLPISLPAASEVSYSEPVSSSKPPITQPHNHLNIPECPSVSPDTHLSSHSSRHSVVTPEDKNEEIYQAVADYPLDLSSLKVADVGRLLKYLGMEKYVKIFKKEMVDGSMLDCMDKESLKSLNVDPFHAKKLIKFIGGWRPKV